MLDLVNLGTIQLNHLYQKPAFVQLSRDITVYDGQDATFTLKIEGKPEPSVKWYVRIVFL